MSQSSESFAPDLKQAATEMSALCEQLFPICRSITGDGVRQTLEMLSDFVEVRQIEVPSGKTVYDWVVPDEWNCREAYIEGPGGQRIVDFNDHSLHVVSYSTAVDEVLDLEALNSHLHSLPEQPNLIPYRTSYYDDNWGFCLTDEQRSALEPGNYRVRIDSTREPGSLTYGEVFVPGRSDEEILVSTHICHPSLANDNLSGIAVASFLARHFAASPGQLHYGLRFIFIPATIGAITWLAENESVQPNIVTGLVLSGVGDSGQLTYKKSRRGVGLSDRLLPELMTEQNVAHEVRDSPRPY